LRVSKSYSVLSGRAISSSPANIDAVLEEYVERAPAEVFPPVVQPSERVRERRQPEPETSRQMRREALRWARISVGGVAIIKVVAARI
jgi:ribosomal protein S12 methylthiotransferase accessory factor YcaO